MCTHERDLFHRQSLFFTLPFFRPLTAPLPSSSLQAGLQYTSRRRSLVTLIPSDLQLPSGPNKSAPLHVPAPTPYRRCLSSSPNRCTRAPFSSLDRPRSLPSSPAHMRAFLRVSLSWIMFACQAQPLWHALRSRGSFVRVLVGVIRAYVQRVPELLPPRICLAHSSGDCETIFSLRDASGSRNEVMRRLWTRNDSSELNFILINSEKKPNFPCDYEPCRKSLWFGKRDIHRMWKKTASNKIVIKKGIANFKANARNAQDTLYMVYVRLSSG